MRILQVCQPSEGGVAKQVRILSTELISRGWEVDVACSPGALADELRASGFEVFTLPLVREASPKKDLAAVVELSKIIRKGAYSLVHVHSAKAGAIGRVAAFISQTPAVYTPHAWSFLASNSALERKVYVAIEQALVALTRRTICVSAGELELGRRLLENRRRLVLVRNGIPAPPTNPDRSPRDRLVVGTVARLSRQKGVEYLIRAAEEVCATHEGVRFTIAGAGPELERLRDVVKRRGLDGRFELIGDVRQVWKYLQSVDVFVLPSLWEGMPFALLEAMGAGLPVVATDVGGVRELIPDETFGIVVPPADPGALRNGILRYLSSEQLREATGVAARRRITTEFSQERMIEDTQKVYREVLAT